MKKPKTKRNKVKRKLRISSLTFPQARVRGITKAKWKRAVNIKEGIARRKRERIIKEQPRDDFKYKKIPQSKVTKYINFDIKRNQIKRKKMKKSKKKRSKDKEPILSDIKGYIVSSLNLSFEQLKSVLLQVIPKNYKPTNFSYAQEYGTIPYTEIVIFRDDIDIYREYVIL